MIRRYRLVVLLLAASVMPLSACSSKPAAGGKCTAGTLACTDAKTGLFCGKDGRFETMTCGGSAGCQTAGDKVTCDQSIASVCDPCPGSSERACETGMKSVLACTDNKFVPSETCKDPGACKVGKNDAVACEMEGNPAATPVSPVVAHPGATTRGATPTTTSTKLTPTVAPVAAPAHPAGPNPPTDSCGIGTKWEYHASSAFGDGRKNDGWACVTCGPAWQETCPGGPAK